MADIGKRHGVDVCLCTVGIAPKATPRTGAEIAALVKPELAIPYHGNGQKEFVAILAKLSPNARSRIIKRGEMFTYPNRKE
jgi:L-ascorbate metabolism protein UlaG (beta-lactamase superfamily)